MAKLATHSFLHLGYVLGYGEEDRSNGPITQNSPIGEKGDMNHV